MDQIANDRLYPAHPLPGVGAVVWNGREILLERRGQPPAQNTWALPGGLIEVGEQAEVAIQREIMEECGITVKVGPVLGLFEPVQRDADGRVQYHFLVIDFLATYLAGDLRVGDDAAEVRWVLPQQMAEYHLTAATSEMIQRGLALVGQETGDSDGSH
jgi:8-oxo-dGTP diphosphatase